MRRQGHFQIGFVHEAGGNIPAHDEIVNVLQKLLKTRIQLVQIGDHGYAGSTCPTSGDGRGLSVVAIHVKGSRIHDPLAIQMGRLQGDPLIAPAKHGPLAPAVDQYERLGARSSVNGDDLGFYARTGERFLMQSRRGVVAQNFQHIESTCPSADKPPLRSLPGPRQHVGRMIFNFGTACGVICEGDEGVGRVQAHTDKVNLGRLRHLASVNGETHGPLGNPKTLVYLARFVLQ